MVSRGNLTWRQAALSALLMSSAVSANYNQETRSTHGGAVSAVRSVEHADRHVQERNFIDQLNSLIDGLAGAADKNAAAAAPSASTDAAPPAPAAAGNATTAGKSILLSSI